MKLVLMKLIVNEATSIVSRPFCEENVTRAVHCPRKSAREGDWAIKILVP